MMSNGAEPEARKSTRASRNVNATCQVALEVVAKAAAVVLHAELLDLLLLRSVSGARAQGAKDVSGGKHTSQGGRQRPFPRCAAYARTSSSPSLYTLHLWLPPAASTSRWSMCRRQSQQNSYLHCKREARDSESGTGPRAKGRGRGSGDGHGGGRTL